MYYATNTVYSSTPRTFFEMLIEAANFIEEDERAGGRIIEDVRGLCHFDHKGRLAAGEIIACANARKEFIHKADVRRISRNIGPDLSKKNNQSNLANVG